MQQDIKELYEGTDVVGVGLTFKALSEAIAAIPKQTDIHNAEARINEALEQAAQGNTAIAETIFLQVEERKAAQGKAVTNREAAEAARHRGALASLHDTEKALQAYRRAVELDLENHIGWHQLGLLLYRTADLQAAESAYRKVAELGESSGDRSLLAVAYVNLGNVYYTRGELDAAEAVFKEALALFHAMGATPQIKRVQESLARLRDS